MTSSVWLKRDNDSVYGSLSLLFILSVSVWMSLWDKREENKEEEVEVESTSSPLYHHKKQKGSLFNMQSEKERERDRDRETERDDGLPTCLLPPFLPLLSWIRTLHGTSIRVNRDQHSYLSSIYLSLVYLSLIYLSIFIYLSVYTHGDIYVYI